MDENLEIYQVRNTVMANSLKGVLAIISEQNRLSGYKPDTIITPAGAMLNWNQVMALRVVTGKATEDDYFHACLIKYV